MTEKTRRVVTIGEVMVELVRGADGRYSLGYGGDTFNTAIYLARAGIPVVYATALGDDPYSDGRSRLRRPRAWPAISSFAFPGACPA